MSEPGYSVIRNNIQAASCNAPSSFFPTSLIINTPFPAVGVGSPLASAQLIFQFDPDATNTTELVFDYAMSTSDGSGTVGYSFSTSTVAQGGAPDGGAPTTVTGTFTPGSGTTMKKLDSSVIAQLALSCVRGTVIRVAFSRPIGAPGTHAGDFQIIAWRLNPT